LIHVGAIGGQPIHLRDGAIAAIGARPAAAVNQSTIEQVVDAVVRQLTTGTNASIHGNATTILATVAGNEAFRGPVPIGDVAAMLGGDVRTATGDEGGGKHPWGDDNPDNPLSPAKIADRLGIPPDAKQRREALRKRLGKWRKDNPKGGWIEDEQGGGRKVKFSYPIGKVWPVVENMKQSS
jgi:hypothetical protein